MFGYNFLSWRHVGSFDAKMATCLGKTVLLQFSAAFSHVSFLYYIGLRFGWSGSLMFNIIGSLSEIGSLLQKNLPFRNLDHHHCYSCKAGTSDNQCFAPVLNMTSWRVAWRAPCYSGRVPSVGFSQFRSH